jgi:hypothetical protein
MNQNPGLSCEFVVSMAPKRASGRHKPGSRTRAAGYQGRSGWAKYNEKLDAAAEPRRKKIHPASAVVEDWGAGERVGGERRVLGVVELVYFSGFGNGRGRRGAGHSPGVSEWVRGVEFGILCMPLDSKNSQQNCSC